MTSPWFVALTTFLQHCNYTRSPGPSPPLLGVTFPTAHRVRQNKVICHTSKRRPELRPPESIEEISSRKCRQWCFRWKASPWRRWCGQRTRSKERKVWEWGRNGRDGNWRWGRPTSKRCEWSRWWAVSNIRICMLAHIIPAPPPQPVVKHPTAALLCTNLPQEVTDDVLSVLFQQYVCSEASMNDLEPYRTPDTKVSNRHTWHSRQHQVQMGALKWLKWPLIPQIWHPLLKRL